MCFTFGQLLLYLHMSEEKVRTIFLYKNYFTDFYNKQRLKVNREDYLDFQTY